MSTNRGIQVTLFDTHVRVPNGMGSFKNVTLQDFYQEIGRICAGADQTSQPKQSFRLPNEAVSVRYNQHELDILMYFEEAKREIRYGDSKYTIPFPATVVFVKLKSNGKGGWAVEGVRWLCTDYKEDEIPNLSEWEITPRNYSNHLWCLPFPNQYGDGNMCVGRNSYRSLYTHDLRGLNELYHHILIASPFNDDLWHRGVNGLNYSGSSPRGWFKLLSEQESFPYHRLSGYPQPTDEQPADDENYALDGDDEEGDDDE